MKLIIAAYFLVLFAISIGGASAAFAEIWGMLILFAVVLVAGLYAGYKEKNER